MHRRAILATVSGLLVTGCTTETADESSPSNSTASSDSGPSPTAARDEANGALGEFYLTNGAEATHTFTVGVERLDTDETLLTETVEVAAGATERYGEAITTMGSYRLSIEADTGATTAYTWHIPTCRDYDYLRIRFFEGDLQIREKHQTIDPAPPTCARDRQSADR